MENVENINNEYGLILIEAKLNNQNINALVDTGSEISLINQNLVEKFENYQNKIMKVPKIALLGANNKKIGEVNKIFNANLKFEDEKEVNVQLFIIPNIGLDVIIGSDELGKKNTVIDYEKKKIYINGNWIKFKEEKAQPEIKSFMYVNREEERRNEEELKIICNDKYKNEILKVIKENKGLVMKESRRAEKYMHTFEVKDGRSFKARTYPIPYRYKDQVKQHLKELMEDNIIERSNTQFINPIVIVKKQNNEIRLCLDARNINKLSIPQYEAPLPIETILGRITNATIFSKIDLKHSFW